MPSSSAIQPTIMFLPSIHRLWTAMSISRRPSRIWVNSIIGRRNRPVATTGWSLSQRIARGRRERDRSRKPYVHDREGIAGRHLVAAGGRGGGERAGGELQP